MTAYIKDVVTLLLENRPEKPLEFIQDYFSNALQGRTQAMRAYRYIRLTRRNRKAFIDNLASAYVVMSRGGEGSGSGLTGAEYLALIKMLCDDFPNQIVASLTQVLDRKETDAISFAVFAAGINACLLYEEFLEHAERLFNACDIEGAGDLLPHPSLEHKIRAAGMIMRIDLLGEDEQDGWTPRCSWL